MREIEGNLLNNISDEEKRLYIIGRKAVKNAIEVNFIQTNRPVTVSNMIISHNRYIFVFYQIVLSEDF